MKTLPVTVRGLPLKTTTKQVEEHFNLRIDKQYPCVAGPVVEELQGGTCSTTVVLQKEKLGQRRDCERLKETFHASPFGGRSSTIAVSDTFWGLNALAGRADASVHVYFVHGLGGHAFKTWANEPRNNDLGSLKAWPRDFLPPRLLKEGVNARTYSIGYNANTLRRAAPNATIVNAAEDLLATLRSDRANEPPKEIYFVCHSLGGIVVCQALNMALFQDENCPNKENYRNLFIHENTCLLKGVVLLGTPLQGSGQANMMAPLVRMIKGLNKFSATNDNFVKSLKEDSGSLDIPRIVQRFKSVVEIYNVELLIGCEMSPYIGASLTTSYESAVTIFKDIVEPFRIYDSDHVTMVKFDDENETEYKKLENLILKMIKPTASSQIPRTQTAPAISNAAGPSRSTTFNTSSDPSQSNSNFRAKTPPNGTGVNVNIYLKSQQNSTGFLPRQYTEPIPHESSLDAVAYGMARSHLGDASRPKQASYLGQRQQGFQTSVPDDSNPFNRLALFDTAFIVDDTGSMIQEARSNEPTRDRWEVTKQALNYISQIAAEQDTDGVELRFLKSDLKGDDLRSVDAINEILEKIDLYDGTHGGGTHFKGRLREVIDPRMDEYQFYKEDLRDYYSNLRQARQRGQRNSHQLQKPIPPKPLNLIVITDGAAHDKPEVEEYIVDVATKLDELKAPKRHIGIQFVQVGEDEDAKKFLEHLDDDLSKRDPPIRDIVDTTPFDSRLVQQNGSFAGALEAVLRKALFGANFDEEDQRANETLPAELELET